MHKHQTDICNLRSIRYGFALSASLALAACGNNNSPQGYFPLQQGLSWHYKVVSATPAGRSGSKLSITDTGTQTIDGAIYQVRKTNTGNFYYLQQRTDGIVRLAKRTIVERHPRFDKIPRFVIKNPPAIGATWTYKTKPYLLNRPQQNDNESLKRSVDYDMTWEIVADDEVVEVKAGYFEHCLHVRGTGSVSLQRPLSIARDEVTFTASEWYAPNVGLVRLEYREDVNSNQTTGGFIIMELIAFEF